MKQNPRKLKSFLKSCSFQKDGDTYEQKYGYYLAKHFPNCEVFWKMFVVPATQRIERVEGKPPILFRDNIPMEIENIANAHYTMSLHLIYAHHHLETENLCQLEDFYTHLASAGDLAETVLEKWTALFFHCRNQELIVLQGLSQDEFLNLASEWYEETYNILYEHYFSKGKLIPIKVPNGKYIVQEYLPDDLWKSLTKTIQPIRQLRNQLVHSTKLGRIIISDGKFLIPKKDKLNHYKTQEALLEASKDNIKIGKDFDEKSHRMYEDIKLLEQALNTVWQKLLADVEKEFYKPTHSKLRDMYDIEFDKDSLSTASFDSKSLQLPPGTGATSRAFPQTQDQIDDLDRQS